MKKKFIDFNTYRNIENNSYTAVERELAESAEIVGNLLNDTNIQVYCINEDTVTFVNGEGNYVQANYELQSDKLILNNIEELVVEQSDLISSRRGIIAKMVDNILSDKEEIANENFDEYFSLPVVKAGLKEGYIVEAKKHEEEEDEEKESKHEKSETPAEEKAEHKKGKKKGKKGLPAALQAWMAKKGSKKNKGGKMSKKDKKDMKKSTLHPERTGQIAKKAGDHKVEEWATIARNILEFVDFRQNGDVYQNVRTKRDTNGNLTNVSIPRTSMRNEGKVLMLTYKDLANILNCRSSAMYEDYNNQSNWLMAVNDMKKFNAMSDAESLQTAFENVVAVWPNLLYLRRDELAKKINESLKVTGARNYDDETCEFLADGVIRTAHKTYTDKVSKIFSAAGKTADLDDFDAFSVVSEAVFKKTDTDARSEYQVFKDLYRSLSEVHNIATKMGDVATRVEVASLIHECENVLNNSTRPNLEVAEDLAIYLEALAESVDFDGGMGMNYTMNPHVSLTGDNPFIHKYGSVNGNPADHPGKYKGAVKSDGKNISSETEDFYTSMTGKDMGDSLSNPYTPKPGDFKMHGEKSIEDDSNELGMYQGDTWPTLKNPYIPDGMSLGDSAKLLNSSDK
jgi:hypothetical protein